MSGRVLKWSVPVDDEWHPIGAGQVLHVECQQVAHTVQVWTLEGEVQGHRAVRVFGTGQPLPDAVRHIGSTRTVNPRGFVWHVFEAADR